MIQDVDGGDAAKFKSNFGRSPFKNPCPDVDLIINKYIYKTKAPRP